MIHSPITDDTILVIDELTGKKTKRLGKLLLTCSVRELYNDLIIDVNNGGLKDVWNDNKLLVSETSLRFLLPDQLKKFTARYQQMYGCEYSIIIKQLQAHGVLFIAIFPIHMSESDLKLYIADIPINLPLFIPIFFFLDQSSSHHFCFFT